MGPGRDKDMTNSTSSGALKEGRDLLDTNNGTVSAVTNQMWRERSGILLSFWLAQWVTCDALNQVRGHFSLVAALLGNW